MPTLKEAVSSNIRYRVDNPDVRPEPVSNIVSRVSMPLVTFQPPVNLPTRGILPPDLIVGTDFYSGARQFRDNSRSSSMIPPNAVSRNRTPQFLSNKKLVAPTIGGGSALGRYNSITAVLTPVAVAAGTTTTQTFTVAGILSSDKVIGYQWVTPQTVGVIAIALRVTGDNLLTVDFSNPTAGSLTPTGGTITLILVR